MPTQRKRYSTGIPKVNLPAPAGSAEEVTPTLFGQNSAGIPNPNRPTDLAPVEYDHDYFCGSTARLYFEEIWVDDIITVTWNASQQKSPIYGYASQFFDAVANGTFLVQGSFSIAFKESAYLYTIMNKLRGKHGDQAVARSVADARQDNSRLARVMESTPAYGRVSNTTKIESYTIEDWMGTSSDGTAQFEAVAEALEDVLWGVKDYDILDDNALPGAIRPQTRIPRPDELDRVGNASKVGRIGQGFDILITYGDINDGPANHTIKTLSGVHLTGSSQTLAPTGEPIAEVYSFFARSIDDRITKRGT